MPTIAAIIPTYNRAHMLKECLESIRGQMRPVDEIIVVNDGSTDDTDAVVHSALQGYRGRTLLLSKANGGKSSALNLGLAHCTSDYVWICDDDDYAAPNALNQLAPALDADPSIGFAYGRFNTFRDADGLGKFEEPAYWARPEEPDTFISFAEGMFTFQMAMLVRRSAYQQVGEFREDLIRSQDYDMTLRLARAFKAVYVPEVIFHQRIHDGQRGAASKRFAAGASEQRWLEYDRKIFSHAYYIAHLDKFTPTFAKDWSWELKRRAALLQRACVYAKRAMWEEAAQDIAEACQTGETKATAQELQLAESVVRTFPTWDILAAKPSVIRGLYLCYRRTTYGRAIIPALCRPLVWQARTLFAQQYLSAAFRRLVLMVSMLGILGALGRLFRSFANRP